MTTPLRQRGLACAVEYGLSDYIVHAELPDGSALIRRYERPPSFLPGETISLSAGVVRRAAQPAIS